MIAVVVVFFDLDMRLFQALYRPDDPSVSWTHDYGHQPAFYTAGIGVLYIICYAIYARVIRPSEVGALINKSAVVFVSTLVLSPMLIITQMKPYANRIRPYDLGGGSGLGRDGFTYPFTNIDLSGASEALSFPSNQAGFAFVFCSLYFPLRRKYPKVAWGFMIAGLCYGAAVSYGRMVWGMHYLTDNVGSLAITLMVATLVTHLTFVKAAQE